MSGPNADAIAALGEDVVRPVYMAFLDIVGDPIRVTNAPKSIAFTAGATGDPDIDGHTFSAIDGSFISLSAVKHKEGGAETVTAILSGLAGVDTDLMNQIGDKANWQGRNFRLWQMQFDENLELIGNIWPRHTGYMTVPKIVGDKTAQTIILDSESYLAFLTAPSNRSYLNQGDYDPDDRSPAASIAAANGQSAAGTAFVGNGHYNPNRTENGLLPAK